MNIKVKKAIYVLLALLLVFGGMVIFAKKGDFLYNIKRKKNEYKISEVLKVDEYKVYQYNQFEILPFKTDKKLDFTFKYTGKNHVGYGLRNWNSGNPITLKSGKLEPGETAHFEIDPDPDIQYWITIADPTEPEPYVEGICIIK